jgi:hypothetical protein
MVADEAVTLLEVTTLIAGIDPAGRSSSAGAAQGDGAVLTPQVMLDAVAAVLSHSAISTKFEPGFEVGPAAWRIVPVGPE